MPYFSIVIPFYNRERVLSRCIESVIRQEFKDYEIILVDDGSTDKSVEKVMPYLNENIKLIKHKKNLGVGPARNTGFIASKGRWIIPLDSDDELTTGALFEIYNITESTPHWVNQLKFMVKFEDGATSPDPPYIDEIIDYVKYISKLDNYKKTEGLNIYRNLYKNMDIWPKNRSTEMLFHLDYMKNNYIRTVPIVVRIYHNDAGNQFKNTCNINSILNFGKDMAGTIDEIIKRHGDNLIKYAPETYYNILCDGCKNHFLAGNRFEAFQYFTKCLKMKGKKNKFKILTYFICGIMSKYFLALFISIWRIIKYN